MKTVTSTIPPEILQYFDRTLLSRPIPDFRDSPQKLFKIYKRLLKKINLSGLPKQQQEKCFHLMKQFEDLYEFALVKEKETKDEAETRIKEPFYHITCSNRRHDRILGRLRITY